MMKKLNARIVPEKASVKVSGPLTKVFEFIKTPPSPMLNQKQLHNALRFHREALINLDMPAIDGMQFEVEPKSVKLEYDEQPKVKQ